MPQPARVLLRRFWEQGSGATAVLFAVLLIPMIIAIGASVDYTRATRVQTVLNRAADAAALAGAKLAGAQVRKHPGDTRKNKDALDKGKATAREVFLAAATGAGIPVGEPTVTADVERGNVVLKVGYRHPSPNAFSTLLRRDTTDLSGLASSAYAVAPTYVDIYLLLDTSNSMGLGATTSAQADMQRQVGCIFGCHVNGSDTYTRTRNLGIQMRVDVLRQAVGKMVDSAAKAVEGYSGGPLRVGVYTFSNTFDRVATPSASFSLIKQDVERIHIASNGGGTNFAVALAELAKEIKKVGDGSSPEKPKVFVFVISDGVEDSARADGKGGWSWDTTTTAPSGPHWGVRPLQADMCQPLKNLGATVSVLYTTYVTFNPITEDRERYLNTNVIPKLPGDLQGCASGPANFLQADQPAEIETAVQRMFGNAVNALRLTH